VDPVAIARGSIAALPSREHQRLGVRAVSFRELRLILL
jgi:hypothetical protein